MNTKNAGLLVAFASSASIFNPLITNLVKLNNMNNQEKADKRNEQMSKIANGFVRPTGMVVNDTIKKVAKEGLPTGLSTEKIVPETIKIINPTEQATDVVIPDITSAVETFKPFEATIETPKVIETPETPKV